MSITIPQIRGARGLLGWSQDDLARRSGISGTSVGSIEKTYTTPRKNTLEILKKTLESGGIEFLPNQGVRMRSGDVRIFLGKEGYLSFFADVYDTIESSENKEVFVSNVDERNFVKWHGVEGDAHVERMQSIKDVQYRILLQEGDNFFPASDYAKYKWLPKDLFASVPFYVYGEKLAIMLFGDEPTIIVLDYPAVAQAYRVQFEGLWNLAAEPNVYKNK